MSELPEDLQAAVQHAFPDQPVADVRLLKGGLSGATIYAANAGGRDVVVRRGHQPLAAREIGCMRIAAAQGVAPELFYSDDTAGISVMAYVQHDRQERGPDFTARVASTLRKLHAGPAFPLESTGLRTVQWVDELIQQSFGQGLPAELLATVTEVAGKLAPWAAIAPCHVDLNPANILETPDRVYFVDWEIAGQGDPFLDLGELGVFAFPTPEARAALLSAYLEREPNEQERHRAILTRVLALGLYTGSFTMITAHMTGSPRLTAEALPMDEMRAALANRAQGFSPAMVAASLYAEMQRELASDAARAALSAI
jgi:aminoglycoside phosphotransferase (APT) family kinase protein